MNRLPRWFVPTAAAVPVAVLAVFYAWPLGTLLATVLDGGSVARTLQLPGIGGVMWFTLWQALASTVATLVVGLAPAYVLARFRFPGRRALLAIVTVPFMLPTVVVGAAFLALLPRQLHATPTAVIVAHVFFNVAVVVRVVGGMWAVLPRDLTGAARTLGARPEQVFRHVVLPLLRPGLTAAGAVVFLFTFTSFGVVKLLGGAANPTVEVEIARRATQLGDVDGAAVLALLQLVVLAVVVVVAARWQRNAATALRGDAAAMHPRSRAERWTVAVVATATAAAMLTPVVVLALRSVRVRGSWTLAAWRNLADAEVRPGISLGVDPLASLGVSVRFAAMAALLSTVVGALAAVAVAAARRHGRLLDVGVMLPLGTSAVTIGLGMLITFDVAPVDWRAEWWLVPVGHSLVAIPFVVRAVLPVLRSVPADLRAAAATLGASPLRAWWWVDGRALRRPLLTGAAFAAAVSLGEFGATTFLTRSGRETVPIAIGRLLGRAGDLPRAQAFALATMLLVVTAAIIATIDALGSDAAMTRGRRPDARRA